jgi:hypothetical protein
MPPVRNSPPRSRYYGMSPYRKPSRRVNTELFAKTERGFLEWFVTPKEDQREFIERTAIEQAQMEGFDRIAIRSNIHNTTRVGRPGEKVRVTCDWHYTVDFYDSDTGQWEAAHVLTDTKVLKQEKETDTVRLLNTGLLKGVENPEYHDAGPHGHFKPPARTDSLHYSLKAWHGSDERSYFSKSRG